MGSIRLVESTKHLREVFAFSVVVVLKHSLTCPASACAYAEVLSFLEMHPATPVYIIHVQTHRPVARYLEKHTGVRHESPQVFVLNKRESCRCGIASWGYGSLLEKQRRRVTVVLFARARTADAPYLRVPLGSGVFTRVGQALSAIPAADEQVLPRRRNVYKGARRAKVPVSGGGLHRSDD